jgi:hypothetical protein
MDSPRKLILHLKPQYFWDVDMLKLNDENAIRLIIERVFTFGEMNEIQEVINHYGEHKTLEVLSNINFFDAKTFNFILKLFNKPPEEFKCYQRKQSIPQHWNL